MATQICPNCKKDSFSWIIDEDISESTIWGCYECRYRSFENESDERNCKKCEKKTETKLNDNEKEYWWCSTCNKTEIIK